MPRPPEFYRRPGYYLAPSLVALINEVDTRWSARSTKSDGWIGDTAHAARRSDHNPDRLSGGVVRAVDITREGIDVDELLEAVIGDARVWYVIYDRRICSATHAWKWRPYDGPNPHTQHVHISIKHTLPAESITARWLPIATEDPEVITDADLERIADAVMKKVEPRLKAYAAYVTKYERQTDKADADRTAAAVVEALDKRERGA